MHHLGDGMEHSQREYLSSMGQALGSIPSTDRQKKSTDYMCETSMNF
jgi:hypothetical protein